MSRSVHPALVGRVSTGLRTLLSDRSFTVVVAAVFFLAVPQMYLIPEGFSDVALPTVIVLAIAPLVLWRSRADWNPVVIVLALLFFARLAALAWSPEPRAGLQPIVLLAQFIVMILLLAQAAQNDSGLLQRLQRFYWPWVAVQAALVVVFRILPGLEDLFLHTIAGLFSGHNAISGLFTVSPNNVLDPAKSGGLFLNANVGALFLGVNGLAAIAFATLTGDRRTRNVGVFALIAVLFTGSKSAAVLAVVLPGLALLIVRLQRKGLPRFRRPMLAAGLAFAAAVVLGVLASLLGFLDALRDAFLGRTVIWGFGAQSFADRPLLGLGYGGWDAGFRNYAATHTVDRTTFPPHNLLLAAWAKTGLIGLVLTVAFFAVVLRAVLRGLVVRQSDTDFRFVAFSGFAVVWLLAQGMGENTDLFGEIHLIPVLALVIVFLYRHGGKEMKYRAAHTRRGRRAAPAVPAVRDVRGEPGPGDAWVPPAVRGPGSSAVSA